MPISAYLPDDGGDNKEGIDPSLVEVRVAFSAPSRLHLVLSLEVVQSGLCDVDTAETTRETIPIKGGFQKTTHFFLCYYLARW